MEAESQKPDQVPDRQSVNRTIELSALSSGLRIGFDGKRALQNFTGLGNYSRYVIGLLTVHYPDNEYLLYSPKDGPSELGNVTMRTPKGVSPLWRSFGLSSDLKADKIDVYHGLSNELPYGITRSGVRAVVTIHDLIFKRFPSYYHPVDRFIYDLKTRYACKAADKIIAISRQTKEDLVSFYNVSPDKIDVVYQDCAVQFREKCSEESLREIKRAYALPDRYILSVGTIENRKNQLLAVQALKELPGDISLVLVGRKTSYAAQIERYVAANALQQRVHILEKVAFADLPAIYQQADLFVYPSEFEGFGIPIVEALHSGVPVIAATGSCLEEAGGPGSVYIDPKDASELAERANVILSDDIKRAEMIVIGKEHLQNFNDGLIARQLLNIYTSAIN